MTMPTAGDDDIAWFDELLPDEAGVTRRPMFGNLGGFVDGQMFIALLGDRIAVRLDPVGCDELLAVDGTGPFEPMPGRPLAEYVALPRAWRDDPVAAAPWVERSLAYALSLRSEAERGRRRAGRRRGQGRKTSTRTGRAGARSDGTARRGAPGPGRATTDAAAPQAPAASNGSTPPVAAASDEPAPRRPPPARPMHAETPTRARRAAKHRAIARQTTTRSAGRSQRGS
jgi:TfoX/Sxy family transcriptional regulator of competence genes